MDFEESPACKQYFASKIRKAGMKGKAREHQLDFSTRCFTGGHTR
ncbi:MAG: hypothetical protein UFR15_06160 [Succiniclasticum sp.]|nr:hypothetical protein [Succiniclasticum sp.]